MERLLGINTNCIKDVDALTALDYIKAAGFDCFFTPAFITAPKEVLAIREKGEQLRLRYEFIHAPFKRVNTLWRETEETKEFLAEVFQSIDNAHACDVPMIILHSSGSVVPPPITEQGFQRFDALVEYAEKKGVKVAIENLRRKEYYGALLERYKDCAHVGFCYDNGHEHWCVPEVPHLKLYGNQLLCTHIHDNFGKLDHDDPTGEGDLHLLPFEGNFDFLKMMQQLNNCGYMGSLMLETRPRVEMNEAKAFLNDAYSRLLKLSKL